MEATPVFIVEKFFPPRCPACEHRFATPSDFAAWAGRSSASSFAGASIDQAQAFPELYDVQQSEGVVLVDNRFGAGFIVCTHCENKTFRIHYGEERVLSRREADRLVEEAGFTSIKQGEAFGTAARPQSTISFLGAADLGRLTAAASAARAEARAAPPDKEGDIFAATLDPALEDLVRRLHQQRALAAVRVRLSERFGELWDRLGDETQRFLATAEILRAELGAYSRADAEIDFSPAVSAYSKALERELLDRVFAPFIEATDLHSFPDAQGNSGVERSVSALRAFAEGQRKLSLGDMSYCLKNVACRLRAAEGNGFATYLSDQLVDVDEFCDQRRFPKHLEKYVMKYRNAAAHVAHLSAEECEAARAYLLEQPVELLITLASSVREPE